MAFKENKINKNLVSLPTIMFTKRALLQLKLIIDNDFTLAGKYFRILVSGKGCDGFTYAAGFTDFQAEDFLVNIANSDLDIQIVIDPFAAFYLQEASVDFIQDFNLDSEGFVIINHGQKNFKGKFWKENPDRTPPIFSDDLTNA